ncbi:MAG: DNA sulfur modification protein DndD [Nitrososphaerota archaeon]|nr:DNA sulfur modification protein DndD [Nitrososphaerota archaeon]
MAIENVGVFRGPVEFDLAPSARSSGRRPIILFGGMNGAGKTTLFESFKLALYGAGAFWPPISRERYEAEMRNRLSRHPSTLSDPARAAVELDVVHAHLGRSHRYTIHREWDFQNKNMREGLQVLCDGVPLNEVEQSLWQDFVWDLIPPGLSRLYFFDGEKIQSLAEDSSGAIQLADSFKSLVGLDLVDRLSRDLEFIVARELGRGGVSKIGKRLESAHRGLEKLHERRAELLSERASRQSDIDSQVTELESRERRLASEGGGWVKHRDAIAKVQAEASAGILNIDARLRELASAEYPFALTRSLATEARGRIEREVESDQESQAIRFLKTRLSSNIESTTRREVASLDPGVRRIVTNTVDRILEEAFHPRTVEDEKVNLNHLSPKEAARVCNWFDDGSTAVAAEVEGLCTRRNELLNRQLNAASKLAKAPSQVQLAPIVSELNALYKRLGEAKAGITRIDEDLAKIDREIEVAHRRMQDIKDEISHQERQSETLTMARHVGAALGEFQKSLVRARLSQVTRSLEESFAALSRKKGWLGKIHVDPESFSVTLIDRGGHPLPKERLAAGEKQIYAVALLWSLARASGRNLPFIIDTPLGRLDSDHRRMLVQSFLPHASEQVIVFSTDTEVDRPYFNALSPHVSRSYHLVHDEGLGMTRAERGYFWEGEGLVAGQ